MNALKAKIEVEEVKEKNFEEILSSKKAIFPEWTVDWIQKKAIDNPNMFWLEPHTSF